MGKSKSDKQDGEEKKPKRSKEEKEARKKKKLAKEKKKAKKAKLFAKMQANKDKPLELTVAQREREEAKARAAKRATNEKERQAAMQKTGGLMSASSVVAGETRASDDGGVASLAASAAAMTVGTAHDEKVETETIEHPEWAAALIAKKQAGGKLSNKERRRMDKYMASLSRDAQLAASASGAHFPFTVASLTCNMMDDKALWNSADHLSIESFTIAGTGAKGTNLFVNAQLKLYQGRRYGLVGPNGAGKSTLLRLISMGRLPMPPSLEFLLVEQEIVGDDTPAFEVRFAAVPVPPRL